MKQDRDEFGRLKYSPKRQLFKDLHELCLKYPYHAVEWLSTSTLKGELRARDEL